MILIAIKRSLALLIVSLVTVSSAASLEETIWIIENTEYYSSLQLMFENGTVHATFRCMNAQGDYRIIGTDGLEIDIHENDTICSEDSPYLTVEGNMEIIAWLNSVTSFSISYWDSSRSFSSNSSKHLDGNRKRFN